MLEADKKKIAKIMEKHGVLVGYLFGSAARGTMGPHSDIDVAVFFDATKVPEEKQFNEKLAVASEITSSFNVENADVINLSTTTDPLIKYIAVFFGELIFSIDENKRFAIERMVVRDYENTRELRRIGRSIMRKQLNDGSFGRATATK